MNDLVARLPAVHRTIIVVDVHQFSHPRRTHRDHLTIRTGLYHALQRAFQRAGILWGECYHEDRGDGVLILAPAHTPKEFAAARLPTALAVEIARHNAANGEGARMQVRIALHAGEVTYDAHGVSSPALIHAFRLLDARAFKDKLATSAADVGVVVSTWFYDEVVQQVRDRSTVKYVRIRAHIKNTLVIGWVTLVNAAPVGRRDTLRLISAVRHQTQRGRHRLRAQRGVRVFLTRILAQFRVRDPDQAGLTALPPAISVVDKRARRGRKPA
nr:hypothetical protein [Kibdelosporangium sp. MJ126-NF4]CEL15551.1 putative protein (80.3 kD) (5T676) / putative protein (80.3 kD) (5T676) [Kibdelosporangium sp. MJ126-NF4]CTQ98217.1 High-affnity carbon uptake protein Hat/HatR [Kibdelosporangium sp. MJ126-NF4]